jgi:hypothetical protein
MSTRLSIIAWSAGSGLLLGLFIDAALVGVWMVLSAMIPSMAPRQLPRWMASAGIVLLAALPLATGVLGYLEGRLKIS